MLDELQLRKQLAYQTAVIIFLTDELEKHIDFKVEPGYQEYLEKMADGIKKEFL
jgi:hypothetical protein